MEVFSFNRQAAAFLTVIAVMVVGMVFLSPFLVSALGGIGVLVAVVVWLKAAIRSRAILAPFGPMEGALALSALLFIIGGATAGGLMVARFGYGDSLALFRAMSPIVAAPTEAPPRRSGAVNYSDPDMNERLKQALAKAGIPFSVEKRAGKDWISWPPEHDAAAESVQEKVRNVVPTGRNVSFPNDPARQKAFTDWLTRNGIKYEVVRQHGRESVVWEEGAEDPLTRFMMEVAGECPKKRKAC